jgi:hypothetical protein
MQARAAARGEVAQPRWREAYKDSGKMMQTARSLEGRRYILRVYKAGAIRLDEQARRDLAPVLGEISGRPGSMVRVRGLASRDEGNALQISRQRLLDFSQELALSGYQGSFVLEVSDSMGKTRGVLVEVEER